MQDPFHLPLSELENERPAFSDCQASDTNEVSTAAGPLSNSPERPAFSGSQVSDTDDRVSTAADQLSNSIEGLKLGCGISTEATTSRVATPLRKRLRFSEEECYNASVALKNKEHKIIMNVQRAKLQAQEAKLKHLDKQAMIDDEKLKQMQMQSLLNAHLLESVTQWKEIAVSVQETVEKVKHFYQVGT